MDFTTTLEPWQYGVGGALLLFLCVRLWLRVSKRRAAASASPESATREPTRATVKVEEATPKTKAVNAADSGKARADVAKTEVVKTKATKSKATKSKATKSKAAKAEAAKSGAAKAGAAKSEAAKSEAVKSEAVKSEAAASKTVKSEAAEAVPAQAPSARVEATQLTADRDHKFVIFAGEATAALLSAALSVPHVFVKNREEFLAACKRKPVAAFIDVDLLFQLKGEQPSVPVVGLLDDSDTLAKTVRALEAFPWLDQVVATTMLSSRDARSSLDLLVRLLINGPEEGMFGVAGVGRVALLAQSSHREARFERMHDFFSKHGLSAKAINAINEVSEELVMNALYDAPAEAGYFKEAVARTEPVNLPPDRACEISYGIDGGHVFVRVRDSFGSLSRRRLHEVLTRCNSKDVMLDESRGGAGLGLWRIFSTATSISISVIPGQLTDVVVRMATTNGRIVKKLHAVQLFFAAETGGSLDSWIPDHESDLMDQSITLLVVA